MKVTKKLKDPKFDIDKVRYTYSMSKNNKRSYKYSLLIESKDGSLVGKHPLLLKTNEPNDSNSSSEEKSVTLFARDFVKFPSELLQQGFTFGDEILETPESATQVKRHVFPQTPQQETADKFLLSPPFPCTSKFRSSSTFTDEQTHRNSIKVASSKKKRKSCSPHQENRIQDEASSSSSASTAEFQRESGRKLRGRAARLNYCEMLGKKQKLKQHTATQSPNNVEPREDYCLTPNETTAQLCERNNIIGGITSDVNRDLNSVSVIEILKDPPPVQTIRIQDKRKTTPVQISKFSDKRISNGLTENHLSNFLTEKSPFLNWVKKKKELCLKTTEAQKLHLATSTPESPKPSNSFTQTETTVPCTTEASETMEDCLPVASTVPSKNSTLQEKSQTCKLVLLLAGLPEDLEKWKRFFFAKPCPFQTSLLTLGLREHHAQPLTLPHELFGTKLIGSNFLSQPWNWLIRNKVFPQEISCSRCIGGTAYLAEEKICGDNCYWECLCCHNKRPFVPPEFFQNVRYNVSDILVVLYHWAFMSGFDVLSKDTKLNVKDVMYIYHHLRELCTRALNEPHGQLGGDGGNNVVQINIIDFGMFNIMSGQEDKSRFTRQKVFVGDITSNIELLKKELSVWIKPETHIVSIGPNFKNFSKKGLIHLDKGAQIFDESLTSPEFHVRHVTNYTKSRIQYMFSECCPNDLADLTTELLQEMLDELQWRERYGHDSVMSFWNMVSLISGKLYERPVSLKENKNFEYDPPPVELDVVPRKISNLEIPDQSPQRTEKEKDICEDSLQIQLESPLLTPELIINEDSQDQSQDSISVNDELIVEKSAPDQIEITQKTAHCHIITEDQISSARAESEESLSAPQITMSVETQSEQSDSTSEVTDVVISDKQGESPSIPEVTDIDMSMKVQTEKCLSTEEQAQNENINRDQLESPLLTSELIINEDSQDQSEDSIAVNDELIVEKYAQDQIITEDQITSARSELEESETGDLVASEVIVDVLSQPEHSMKSNDVCSDVTSQLPIVTIKEEVMDDELCNETIDGMATTLSCGQIPVSAEGHVDFTTTTSLSVTTWPLPLESFGNYRNFDKHILILKNKLNKDGFFSTPMKWVDSYPILANSMTCPYCFGKNFQLQPYENSIDGYAWLCKASQCKGNDKFQKPKFLSHLRLPVAITLHLIFHWVMQSQYEEMLKVSGLLESVIIHVYTKLRELCSSNLGSDEFTLGGKAVVVEVGIYKFGVFYILGALDQRSKNTRLKVLPATCDLAMIEAELVAWINPASVIMLPFLTINIPCSQLIHSSSHTESENRSEILEYLKNIISKLFGNFCTTQMGLQTVQLILDEVQWRQRFGASPVEAFENIFALIAQFNDEVFPEAQTRISQPEITCATTPSNENPSADSPESVNLPSTSNANPSFEAISTSSHESRNLPSTSNSESEPGPSSVWTDWTYRCVVCEVLVERNVEFVEHAIDHMDLIINGSSVTTETLKNKNRPFRCFCSFKAAKLTTFQNHFASNHQSHLFCQYCLEFFYFGTKKNCVLNTEGFFDHLKSHTLQAPKRCTECQLFFLSTRALNKHQKVVHKIFPQNSQNSKNRTQFAESGANSVLPVCNESMENRPNSSSRKRSRKVKGIEISKRLKQLRCLECNRELRKNHFLGPAKCSCGYFTECKQAFSKHMAEQHSEDQQQTRSSYPLGYVARCQCNFNTKDGNAMADHQTICKERCVLEFPFRMDFLPRDVKHTLDLNLCDCSFGKSHHVVPNL